MVKSMHLITKSVALLAVVLVCSAAGCRKDKNDVIPLVPVDIRITTTDPLFINLTVPGGFEYVTGGSNGILIYRRSSDEFMAFDRHCTYNVDDYCQVAVDSTWTSISDTCCDSRYLILDGSVTNGPATRGLQQYQTAFDGTLLRVYN